MFALLINKKYASGTVLEVCDVGEEKWRQVELLNDNGPSGPASTTSNKAAAIEGIMQYLQVDGVLNGAGNVIATD